MILNEKFQTLNRLGKVMVSLTPMTSEVKANSWVLFTCSYEYPNPLYISFKLTSVDNKPVTAINIKEQPVEKTAKGSLKTLHVYIQQDPFNVECHIWDQRGKTLVKVVTSVTPGLTGQIKGIFVFVCPWKAGYIMVFVSIHILNQFIIK